MIPEGALWLEGAVSQRVGKSTSEGVIYCYSDDMNSRLMIAGLGLSLVGTLAACVGGGPGDVNGDAVKPQIAAELTVSAAAKLDPSLKPRLVGRYYTINAFEQNNNNVKRLKLEPSYDELKYKPNASAFPGFENWDVLEMRKVNNTRSDYLRLTLTRDAKVAVLSSSRLSWMDGTWTEGLLPDKTTKTFVKSFLAGEAVLGAPAKDDAYTTLIAEADGKASVYPKLPAGGPSGAEQPKPNETCPAWLDNLYVTTGSDGNPYKSWHPQIDPVYHCYFKHEHGSDPALVGLPGFALEYVATVNNNQPELHEGFKGIAIRDEAKKIGWYINIHSETHDLHRVCTQKHTVVVIVTDLTKTYPSNMLAMVGYKGDFGASIANRDVAGKNVIIDKVTNPSFPNCPSQTDIANSLKDKDGNQVFFKRIRVENTGDGKLDNGGYENWQGGLTSEVGLSSSGDTMRPRFKLDIRNPSTTCSDMTCSAAKPNDGSHGDERTFSVSRLKIEYSPLVRVKDEQDGVKDGTFYTDVYGLKVVPASATAIKQFVQIGASISGPDGGFHSEDAWRGLYVDDNDAGVPRLELDNAFGTLN